MTLLSEASFLVTPNGYKEDKLYAAIPTNGNGDMTFTRATTATRVNEAGLVELVPYNLLLRSEEFDNASWNKTQVNVTANALTAPNGTLTADFLIPTAVSSTHTISQAASGTATFTIFAKQGGYKRFRLLTNTSGNGYASFNLETGLVTTASGTYYVSSGIEDFGNGWYRCRLVLSGAEATFTVAMEDASGFSGAWTGDGTSGIYFWGAQVVEGTSALTYQKTVDRLDIPRIDYTGGGCPSILLEPQRTNIVLRSQEFDNAAWLAASVTATASSGVSPDGTNNAYLINVSVPSAHSLKQTITVTASTAYVFSFWAKRGTITNLTYSIYDNSAGANILLTNYYSQTNSSTWTRINIPFTTPVGCTNIGVYPIRDTPATGTFYLYGAQLEAGAYPTSYIPTTTGTVTRNADAISKTGISDLLNPSEGTFYAEISALANDLTNRILSLSDGTDNDAVQIRFSSVSNQIRLDTFGAGATYRSTVTVLDITENHKLLIKWGPSGIFGFVDGDKYTLTLASGTGSGIPTALDRINFSTYYGAAVFYGKCKGVQIYKTALSDPQCQALTTL
jgi:hypothetical protein